MRGENPGGGGGGAGGAGCCSKNNNLGGGGVLCCCSRRTEGGKQAGRGGGGSGNNNPTPLLYQSGMPAPHDCGLSMHWRVARLPHSVVKKHHFQVRQGRQLQYLLKRFPAHNFSAATQGHHLGQASDSCSCRARQVCLSTSWQSASAPGSATRLRFRSRTFELMDSSRARGLWCIATSATRHRDMTWRMKRYT